MQSLEELWNHLLSQDPLRISEVFNQIDSNSQNQIIQHLQRMIHETGWQPMQKENAKIALEVITNMLRSEGN